MIGAGEAPEQEGHEPGADIARHLDRHGVRVEIRHVTGWSDPAEALLNETQKAAADLIVMGGYGHSRFREWILGGMTRDVLSLANVPVLLAH
jgi:nucleotide-binding universal stress UspA family protein